MKTNILLITTMYPDPLRPVTTDICHIFAKEWEAKGCKVMVIHYRSMFPRIYTDMARLFPKLAYKYVGNYVEMDREMKTIQYEIDGIPVFSIPVFKYLPHGKYARREIDKQVAHLHTILKESNFSPDAIIGHFYNPTMEIVGRMKEFYPQAKTCVSLHELDLSVIRKCYPKNYMDIINSIDTMGFRSVPIKNRFESIYGSSHKSLVCWSGTPKVYIDTPSSCERKFSDGPLRNFIYVGQTIKRKFPKETVESVHKAMDGEDFVLTYVGTKDAGYPETKKYIDDNGIEDKVIFTGQIPRSEIIKYYDKSDCFIMMSKNEVFGLVYLEAMSRGCITIAAKDEGMEGIIENGINGFLCEAGNVEELTSIIKSINNLSASEKQLLSDNAKKTAIELSDTNVAMKYLSEVMK